MDSSIMLTITILSLLCILFAIAAINRKRIPQKQKARVVNKLKDLESQVNSEDNFARRDAIIKLDNLLSKALQIRYKNDKSCGDNLKLAKNLFRKDTYQSIWDIHKLRNDIVHKDSEVTESECEEAYRIYKMSINKILE